MWEFWLAVKEQPDSFKFVAAILRDKRAEHVINFFKRQDTFFFFLSVGLRQGESNFSTSALLQSLADEMCHFTPPRRKTVKCGDTKEIVSIVLHNTANHNQFFFFLLIQHFSCNSGHVFLPLPAVKLKKLLWRLHKSEGNVQPSAENPHNTLSEAGVHLWRRLKKQILFMNRYPVPPGRGPAQERTQRACWETSAPPRRTLWAPDC